MCCLEGVKSYIQSPTTTSVLVLPLSSFHHGGRCKLTKVLYEPTHDNMTAGTINLT
jgi:hypothetical protein